MAHGPAKKDKANHPLEGDNKGAEHHPGDHGFHGLWNDSRFRVRGGVAHPDGNRQFGHWHHALAGIVGTECRFSGGGQRSLTAGSHERDREALAWHHEHALSPLIVIRKPPVTQLSDGPVARPGGGVRRRSNRGLSLRNRPWLRTRRQASRRDHARSSPLHWLHFAGGALLLS